MTAFLIIFLFIILVMATMLTIAVKVRSRNRVDDSQYYNEDGDHIYYDRSRIEKKRFREKNPDVRDVRSFRRLFREFRDDRQIDRK